MSVQDPPPQLRRFFEGSIGRLLLPKNGPKVRPLSDRMQSALDNERGSVKGHQGWINLMVRWVPEVRRLELWQREQSAKFFGRGMLAGYLISAIISAMVMWAVLK